MPLRIMETKLCPAFKTECKKSACELWNDVFGRCDGHAFLRVIIDNGGL